MTSRLVCQVCGPIHSKDAAGLQGESLSMVQRDIYRMEVKADS